ncbi:MAG: LysE family translocator [Bacteroidota bacterium]
MDNYVLYITMAAAAILSPGPGVTLTLTNAIRFGLAETAGGIVGLAAGAMIIATLSATGIGLLLAASPVLLNIMKYIGAAYLIYLGVKLWRSSSIAARAEGGGRGSWRRCFMEAITLQFSNPKAIFFFISIFPQFIDDTHPYIVQFLALVLTYGLLVILIHFLYALTAHKTKAWFSSSRGARIINRVSGSAFIFFGIALAGSSI